MRALGNNKRSKLLKLLSDEWSRQVRARDKRCILCGNTQTLQAHHWIVSRARSLKYRFDLRNGVSLCYGCHIHGIHTNPTVQMLDRLRKLCVIQGIATESDIEEIIHDNTIYKVGIHDLEDMLKELKNKTI